MLGGGNHIHLSGNDLGWSERGEAPVVLGCKLLAEEGWWASSMSSLPLGPNVHLIFGMLLGRSLVVDVGAFW